MSNIYDKIKEHKEQMRIINERLAKAKLEHEKRTEQYKKEFQDAPEEILFRRLSEIGIDSDQIEKMRAAVNKVSNMSLDELLSYNKNKKKAN